jgi:hypothetical protein
MRSPGSQASHCQNNRILILIALLACVLWVPPGASAASTMRCGNSLITPGDTKVTVERECGPPAYREVISGEDEPRVEQWLYEFGYGRFPYLLTFKGLRLVRIQVLTRQ